MRIFSEEWYVTQGANTIDNILGIGEHSLDSF